MDGDLYWFNLCSGVNTRWCDMFTVLFLYSLDRLLNALREAGVGCSIIAHTSLTFDGAFCIKHDMHYMYESIQVTQGAAGPPTRSAAGRPARRQRYRRQQTTTDASQQNNTGPLGGPVINCI